VRQALSRLEQQGLIDRRRGHGTFAAGARPRTWLLQSVEGFFEDEHDRGRSVTSEVLECGIAPLPAWAASALGVPPESDGTVIERLRAVDGKVALYVVNHLRPELAATVSEFAKSSRGSLYRELRLREGLEVAGGRRVVEAVAAGKSLARMLEVAPGEPLVFIQSVSWGPDMRVFDCYRTWVRSDRMRIDVQVAADVASGEHFDLAAHLEMPAPLALETSP
jgi:GntR family transcriptional regulator